MKRGLRLSPADWKWIQKSMPVVCVDFLPVQLSPAPKHELQAVGLIYRETPRGRRWCLIGGRLLYGESLTKAIRRQASETLGRHVKVHIGPDQQPLYIAQYSPSGRAPFSLDPRQHAVGLTFAVEMEGRPTPRGEAIKFAWFGNARIPAARGLGFGQNGVIEACVRLLRTSSAAALGAR